MEKLGLGMVILICATILGCSQTGPASSSPPVQPMQQSEPTGADRGGMH